MYDADEDMLDNLGQLIYQSEIESELNLDDESERVQDADEEMDEATRVLFLDENEDEDEEDAEEDPDVINPIENEERGDASALPDTVFSVYFRELQYKLSKETRDIEENLRQTIWIEPPLPYFSLRGQIPDPSPLYLPRVFVWRPHLRQKLACKFCNGSLVVKGWNKKPHARRFIDLER